MQSAARHEFLKEAVLGCGELPGEGDKSLRISAETEIEYLTRNTCKIIRAKWSLRKRVGNAFPCLCFPDSELCPGLAHHCVCDFETFACPVCTACSSSGDHSVLCYLDGLLGVR